MGAEGARFDEALARAAPAVAGPTVVSVYLFGSHARERAHRESDVDIGVLLRHAGCPTARDRFEAGLRLIHLLASELGESGIDVVILNDAPPTLGRAVVVLGRRVYCADEAVDRAFVRDVQLCAADIAPWLERTRARKLEAIGR